MQKDITDYTVCDVFLMISERAESPSSIAQGNALQKRYPQTGSPEWA
jgi:hypothetical protein